MSVNWTLKEFASRLRSIEVPAYDLCRGDIVLVDGQPWGVDCVEKKGGLFFIYDSDKNGTGGWKPTQKIRILPRHALREVSRA